MATRLQAGTRVLVLTLLVGFLVLPGVAAAESRSGGTIVVEEGETVDGDLDAVGGTVVVRGTVTGDLNAFAGTVVVEGTVGGDVDAAGGNVDVARNGTVGGDLEVASGTVHVAGTVEGNAEIGARDATLAGTSRIGGDLDYAGTLTREDGAVVGGSVSQGDVQVSPVGGVLPSLPNWAFDAYGYLLNLGLGALLLVVAPAFSRRVTDTAVEDPLRSGGLGLVGLFAVLLSLVVFALTIIGIPLTLLGAVLFGFTAWVGAVYGRVAVGTWLSALADVESRWLALFIGVTAIAVLTRLPWVGEAIDVLVFLLGFGALASNLTHDYRRRRDRDAGPDSDSGDRASGEGRPA